MIDTNSEGQRAQPHLLLPRCAGQPPQDRETVIAHQRNIEGDYGLRTLCEPDEAYVEYVTPIVTLER